MPPQDATCGRCQHTVDDTDRWYHHGILIAQCRCGSYVELPTSDQIVDWIIYEAGEGAAGLPGYRGDTTQLGRGYATRDEAEDRARMIETRAASKYGSSAGVDLRVAPRRRIAMAPARWKQYRAIIGDLTPNRATVVRVLPDGTREDVPHRPDQRMAAHDHPLALGDRVWITGPDAVAIVS